MDSKVEQYFAKQKPVQKKLCLAVRKIILSEFPQIEEKMALGVPYYGGKFYLVGLKDHINFGFAIDTFKREELKQFQGSGKTVRVLEIHNEDEIDETKIRQILKRVMAD